MIKELNARIKHKSDTSANWNARDIVLLDGELGIVNDNGELRVGDGTKKFSELPSFKDVDSTLSHLMTKFDAELNESGHLILTIGNKNG